jgi:uncharacterized protein involved in exopolysaccharide biosynthesis
MIKKLTEDPDFESKNIIDFIYNWRRVFFIIAIASVFLSYVFSSSFFITPKFKSTVILIPASTNSSARALMSDNYVEKENILNFGEEEQVEQLLQIINSNEIKIAIMNKYNLMEHYKIDPTSKYKYSRLFDEFNNNIHFSKTEFMAIEIEVLDKDPWTAASIANDIASYLDTTFNRMKRERALQAFIVVEKQLKVQKEYIKTLEDSIYKIRALGINDYESQSERYNQALANAVAQNNKSAIKALEEKLDLLSKYGGQYVSLRNEIEYATKLYYEIRAKYFEVKVDIENNLPNKFVVDKGLVSDRKAYPIRWLIIVISTFSTLLLGMILLMLIEKLNLKKKIPALNSINNVYQVNKEKINTVIEEIKKTKINIDDMENYFNSMNLIKLVIKWKIHLAIILVLSIVLSFIFSGPSFIKPKYKSFADVYPANIQPYSEESTTEQMIQILSGQDIKDSIINKFDLGKHYRIDKSYKYYYSALLDTYRENVTIKKTEFESVNIEVYDESPIIACNIVNGIIDFYNKKVKYMHKSKYAEAVTNYQAALMQKKRYIDSLQNELYLLGKVYGITDVGAQSREIAKGFFGTSVSTIKSSEILKMKKNMEEKGGEFLKLSSLLGSASYVYEDFKNDYDIIKMAYERDFTYVNYITKPYVADKKAYPKRFLIIIISTIASLFLTVLVIGIIEKIRLNKVNS